MFHVFFGQRKSGETIHTGTWYTSRGLGKEPTLQNVLAAYGGCKIENY